MDFGPECVKIPQSFHRLKVDCYRAENRYEMDVILIVSDGNVTFFRVPLFWGVAYGVTIGRSLHK